MSRILIIDPQFETDADIEREVAGPDIEFEIERPGTNDVCGDALGRADAVVNCRSRHKLPANLIAQMDKAKVVVQAGVGFDHIDIDACAQKGIPVCNTPDYGTMEVADHTIALTLGLVRAVTTYNNRLLIREDGWNTLALPVPPVRRLRKQVFGVVGLGRIGLATALRARALEMEILFYDPFLPAGFELSLGIRRAPDLESLLFQADIVSLHCPLTPRTDRLINRETLGQMKDNAILINTSRGGVVDLDALHWALAENKLCAAALDVLQTEPIDRSHPLIEAWSKSEPWLEGRLLLTPHAAFFTPESLQDMRRLSMLAAVKFLRDGTLRSCVNREQLQKHGFSTFDLK